MEYEVFLIGEEPHDVPVPAWPRHVNAWPRWELDREPDPEIGRVERGPFQWETGESELERFNHMVQLEEQKPKSENARDRMKAALRRLGYHALLYEDCGHCEEEMEVEGASGSESGTAASATTSTIEVSLGEDEGFKNLTPLSDSTLRSFFGEMNCFESRLRAALLDIAAEIWSR
ncbi:hypothetical protein EJ06DRAFT_270461 [Trichodelitschia bisporula]|uniref:Uncharacterized protein n=1 Tax=Trichodelitschia bisporula TaxID=703511 RepID=A0A6G1HHM2_9PEZI|nr:hypothetical protein EJ06DRAFT_270461 [Trichodelitschia bisporula]